MKTCKSDEAIKGEFSASIQPFSIIFCNTEFQATQLKSVRMPHSYQSVVVELECEGDHEKLRHACPDKSSEARPQKSIKSRPTHSHIRTMEILLIMIFQSISALVVMISGKPVLLQIYAYILDEISKLLDN